MADRNFQTSPVSVTCPLHLKVDCTASMKLNVHLEHCSYAYLPVLLLQLIMVMFLNITLTAGTALWFNLYFLNIVFFLHSAYCAT